jgi:hypothetical protein
MARNCSYFSGWRDPPDTVLSLICEPFAADCSIKSFYE